MYYLLTMGAGVLVAVMIVLNGGLSDQLGVYSSNAFIHLSGMALIAVLMIFRRVKPVFKKIPLYLYLGGAIGVLTVIFNNLSFGKIDVSVILALSLFGQSLTSVLIDQFGFMGMEKHPIEKGKIIGLIVVVYGIFYMVTEIVLLPVVLSFLSGITLVLSRTFNAKLAEKTSPENSTFFNYFVGLSLSVIVLLILGRNEPMMTEPVFSSAVFSPEVWIYCGGFLGVCVILLFNVIVPKIPSFYMTLFLFVSQIFAGIFIDILLSGGFSPNNFIGGAIVAVGLYMNIKLDGKTAVKQEKG